MLFDVHVHFPAVARDDTRVDVAVPVNPLERCRGLGIMGGRVHLIVDGGVAAKLLLKLLELLLLLERFLIAMSLEAVGHFLVARLQALLHVAQLFGLEPL
jgi:hypothetical protein